MAAPVGAGGESAVPLLGGGDARALDKTRVDSRGLKGREVSKQLKSRDEKTGHQTPRFTNCISTRLCVAYASGPGIWLQLVRHMRNKLKKKPKDVGLFYLNDAVFTRAKDALAAHRKCYEAGYWRCWCKFVNSGG